MVVGGRQEVLDPFWLGPAKTIEHLVLLVGQCPLQTPPELLVQRLQRRVTGRERGVGGDGLRGGNGVRGGEGLGLGGVHLHHLDLEHLHLHGCAVVGAPRLLCP